MKIRCSIIFLAWMCVSLAAAQTPPHVAGYTLEHLEQMAQPLHAIADASNGTATSLLASYPGYRLMLVYRDRSGEVELHEEFTDAMFILSGRATLITGGKAQHARRVGPGEIRGTSIVGGSSLPLAQGGLTYIPADTPHKVIVPVGGSITYVVVKVQPPGNK